ncbi:HupE/UreJ family protein [Sinorhizobium sp. RAC02]|uniref:HupE/UreJ family protein n=1 Tax=Sinorhizobium sp. RAC02 TaxID=1842534 RepID=UPI00083CA5EF|nr:HupE/UreJ family protein [Sinorhizobium sp. RAC02]AOF91371.1 hupE / UreJ family protein [Sinorhizobium sp. RAC02]
MIRRMTLALAALAATTAPAFAHLNPEEHGSFMAGFSHPLFGLDHILVMLAVGLWAAQIGGRALWAVPAAFVTTMAIGFSLAVSGIALPFVEPAILASVVALGLLVAMAVKLDTVMSAAIVAVFALFHGHAHGGELGAAGAWQFGIGFVVATALLHGAGIGLGLGIARLSGGALAARIIGGLTALTGLVLAFG